MHIKHEIGTTDDSRGTRTTTFIHAESQRIEPSVGDPPVGNTLSLDISYPGGLCCLFMTTEQAMGVAIGILEALHKAGRKQDAAIGARASMLPEWLAEAMEKSRQEQTEEATQND